TTPLTKNLHATLAAVQWAFTFFVLAQTWLVPINAYLVDRFGARAVVSVAGVLVGVSWMGAGLAKSLTALYVAYAIGGVGAACVYGATIRGALEWVSDPRGPFVGGGCRSFRVGPGATGFPHPPL